MYKREGKEGKELMSYKLNHNYMKSLLCADLFQMHINWRSLTALTEWV